VSTLHQEVARRQSLGLDLKKARADSERSIHSLEEAEKNKEMELTNTKEKLKIVKQDFSGRLVGLVEDKHTLEEERDKWEHEAEREHLAALELERLLKIERKKRVEAENDLEALKFLVRNGVQEGHV